MNPTPDIGELRRLESAATKAPWEEHPDNNADDECGVYFDNNLVAAVYGPDNWGGGTSKDNAALIAVLRNAAPALLAAAEECERLRAALEDAVETLEAMDLHIDNPLYERLRNVLEPDDSALSTYEGKSE